MEYASVKELFTAICDSVRSRNGSTELIEHQDIPNVLDACPFAISGTFISESDTKTFKISGLPFAPTSLLLICSDEVAKSSNKTPDAVVCSALQKGLYGSLLYSSASGGSQLGSVKPTSSMIQWNADGVNFTISSALTAAFKTGLVYTYYITGGIER